MPPIEQTEPYIPNTDLAFKVWLQNFAQVLQQDPVRFGMTSADALVVWETYISYRDALDLSVMPGSRNSTTVAAKDGQRASAMLTVRPIAQILKANKAISNEDKALLGIHINDTTKTPIPQPSTAPMLNIQAAFSGEHQIRYVDEMTPESRKKPYGCIQLELYVHVGPTPTVNPDEATFVGVYTKNPIRHAFNPTQSSMTATYFARWRTRTGLAGPWSLPVAMVIAFGGPVEQQLQVPIEGAGGGVADAA